MNYHFPCPYCPHFKLFFLVNLLVAESRFMQLGYLHFIQDRLKRKISHFTLIRWSFVDSCFVFSSISSQYIVFIWLSEQLINDGVIIDVDDGYMCMSCGKRRKEFSKMRVHLIAHGINNEHPCPFCGKVQTSQDHRKRHIQNIHKKTLSYKQIRALPRFQNQIQTNMNE